MDYEEQSTTLQLATKIIGEEDMTKFLEGCYVLFEIKNDQKNKKKIKEYLTNQHLMRRIKAADAIKETSENKAYYYGQDKGIGDPFRYEEETEGIVTNIRLELLSAISKIIREEEDQEINIG
jgi:hypothetical protein